MRQLPLVSCLCPTYGRPELLREAIWCFLLQDYPNKELVILNDHHQPIQLDREYPGVQIHNCAERFATMGQKRNRAVELGGGGFLLNWDDDDLSLPWRITTSVEQLLAAPEKWIFKPTRAWQSTNNQGYYLAHNYFHGQAAMRRCLFDHLGPYKAMNAGQDVEFEMRVPVERRLNYPATPSELFFIYRWGNSCAHISQFGIDQPGRQTGWERMAERYRDQPGGVIAPGFDHDYWRDLIADASRNSHVAEAELDQLTRRLQPYQDRGEKGRGHLMFFADWDPTAFTFPGDERLNLVHGTNMNMMMNLEARFLAYLASKAPKTGSFVEIGSRSAKSTSYLAQVTKNQGREPMHAIDLWEQAPTRWNGTGSYAHFLAILEQLDLIDVVIPLKGDSKEIGANWQQPIALLFIDGDHSYEGALADYERFTPHLVPGGIVAFHDYCHGSFPNVRRVIEEVVIPSGLWSDFAELKEHNGIWCARKRA